LLFTTDRVSNVTKNFKIDQPIHAVFFRKAGNHAFFVPDGSSFKIVRNSDVKSAGEAGEDINVVMFLKLIGVLRLALPSLAPLALRSG